jgi:HlyD family secretion protein
MKPKTSDNRRASSRTGEAGKEMSAPARRASENSLDDSLAELLKEGRKRTRRRRILSAIALSAVAVGVFAGVMRWKKGDEASRIPQHVTERVTKGDLIASISATGTVEALNTVEVGAEISGRILSLHADFNDTVSEGQVLAVIDPEQLKAAVDEAAAHLLAADAAVAESRATLLENKQNAVRAEELAAKGLYSSQALESAQAAAVRAEASLKSARASYAQAKATLKSARSRLEKSEILCPINGTVLSREVEVGQTLNAGMSTPVLYKIAEDLKRMRLTSLVDEADIGNVFSGQTATFTVDAYPGREFKSEVTSVRNVPQTDDNVVSYEVLLSVDNREMLLKPGMTASVEIVTQKRTDMLLVSNKAFRFSPPMQGRGFRGRPPGGMGFLGGGKRKQKGAAETPLDALGKIAANEGILWVRAGNGGPPGAVKPLKVEKIATDGVHTAVKSDEIHEGDEVIVEQVELEQEDP